MADKFIYAWRDFDGDRQEVSYDVATAGAVGWGNLATAIEAWNVGAGAGGGFYDEQSGDTGLSSTNPLSQNSLQAIMELRDTVTGRVYRKRIPFPDLGKADDVGTNPAFTVVAGLTCFNTAHADYAPLQTAVEANLISPSGNAVTLERVYIEE